MRVGTDDPVVLYNVVQSFKPCMMFTVDMRVWNQEYVPHWLYVIPYDSGWWPASQPHME